MSVGLCMIVRNEEKVIERSLRSAFQFVDCWCIVDTGSTDRTMEIVRRVAKECGKPGSLHESKWVNFGHNRTEALELARNYMDWILMMDADDSLEGAFRKEILDSRVAGYTLQIKCASLVYRRPQLFNSQFPWKYVGALHEYATCVGPQEPYPDTLWVIARTEGFRSSDPQKYHKDAELLEQELQAPHCDRARTLFYLAQSYKDSGQTEKALDRYRERADFTEGWNEEIYVSCLYIIRLTTDPQEKLRYAWKAQQVNPRRRDVPYELLTWARRQGVWSQEIYALGLAFQDAIMHTRYLFVFHDAYSYKYEDELSIVAYYTGHYVESKRYAEYALEHCTPDQRDRIQTNVQFAVSKMDS